MSKYPPHLSQLIALIRKLPGVGTKTAERYAFQMLSWQESQLKHLALLIETLKESVQFCPECHCILEKDKCSFCDASLRDTSTLCILSSAKDVFAMEETRIFKGLYHVIEGLLSPMDGRMPNILNAQHLKDRITKLQVKEVIIALDSTLEGDATSLFLKDCLKDTGIKVSRLAFGLPMGSPLEYVDGGTLSKALTGRQNF